MGIKSAACIGHIVLHGITFILLKFGELVLNYYDNLSSAEKEYVEFAYFCVENTFYKCYFEESKDKVVTPTTRIMSCLIP